MVNCHVVANRMSIIYVTDIICVAIRYWFFYKKFQLLIHLKFDEYEV